MASVTITNDPDAITIPSPSSITLVSQVSINTGLGSQSVNTRAQANALNVPNGTIIYVQSEDANYVKHASGVRPIMESEPEE